MGDGDDDEMKVGETGRSGRVEVSSKAHWGSFAREMEGQDARAATSSLTVARR